MPAMVDAGWSFTLSLDAANKTTTACFVRLGYWHEITEPSDEIPRAICRAALAALDQEGK